ncbi:apolipoprotein N-acyltransferase [Nocardioides kribbensis]|uniref:apolipoprotein N-acyltransferase n=1 Tax=Nocardioides kribbensis TaxID=305517 RepID=UPI0032DA60CE
MLIRSLGALLAGAALSLAFEPVAVPAVLPLAVAAFFVCAHGLSARRGLVVGLAFGLSFYLVHIWWMRAVAVPAWIALSVVEALFYAALGAAVARLSTAPRTRGAWPLWAGAAWVAAEVVRSGWPFSGMPWGRLAFAVVDTPVAASLPWVGMVGVSALLALGSALLAWLVVATGRSRLAAGGALAGLVALLAVPALAPYDAGARELDEAPGTATVAAVQGDVPGPLGNDVLYDFRQVTENHVQATVDLAADFTRGEVARPDFVLWPENSTAVDPFSDVTTRTGIERAVGAIGVPVVVGGLVDDGPDHVLNQGIVWDPVSGAGERYTKWHPVPYGEYIPFRQLLDVNFGELARIQRDMRAGTRVEPLEVAGVSVADAICFDIAYDDGIYAQVTRGGELLTVQTSNATFIQTDQIDQQFAITRLRAIETGRWTVVASTNGVSGVISPTGEVVETADPRTTAVLVSEVGLTSTVTPGVRVGPWVARLCILASLLGLLAAVVPYRRRPTLTHRTSGSAPALAGHSSERGPA